MSASCRPEPCTLRRRTTADARFAHAALGLAILGLVACGGPIGPVRRPAPVPGGTPSERGAAAGLSSEMGQLRVGFLRNGEYAVAVLDLEPYVARVLGGEAAPKTHPSAMAALAIAVRTYALANRGKHAAEGFDVCDQTHCQVVRTANPAAEIAAEATAGQVLLDHGAPATIYYSASCGGRTEIPSAVWPGVADPPFLPSRKDDACRGQPEWSTEIALADLERALLGAGFTGELTNVRIASRNSSKRVATLRLDGMTPNAISGQDLRMAVGRILGPRAIMSTAFDLKKDGDRYRLSGHGYGHGVGMCVTGAMQLALDGQSAQRILNKYFPGLKIDAVR